MESFFYEEIFWEMKVKDSVLTQKRDYAKRELRKKKTAANKHSIVLSLVLEPIYSA